MLCRHGLFALEGGERPALGILPPQIKTGAIEQRQRQPQHQRADPEGGAQVGISLVLIHLGDHQPGGAGDGGGVGQNRDVPIIPATLQDAVLTEGGLAPSQGGRIQRAGQRECGIRVVPQRGQIADLVTFRPDQESLCSPGRHRPGFHQRIKSVLRLPDHQSRAQRRRVRWPQRRQHAIDRRYLLGVAVQIEEFEARLAQDVPHQVQVLPGFDLANGEHWPGLSVEHGQPAPVAPLRHRRHPGLHLRQQRRVLPPAVEPLPEHDLQPGVAVKISLGINPGLGDQGFELLPFLFGDDGQSAVGVFPDIRPHRPVNEHADRSDQQRQGEQQHEAPSWPAGGGRGLSFGRGGRGSSHG